MKLTSVEQAVIETAKAKVGAVVERLPHHPAGFNWGFLWGNVTIQRKSRTFETKVCFGSFCPESWTAVMAAAGTVEGVRPTHYNMD